jgi:tRNA G18 (ribose-2'-O)-methylase SpoU
LVPLEKLKLNQNDNILLIFGSEGEGVSRAISKAADHRIVIPPQLRMDQLGKFPFDMIDSLNVGVSAALILYHIRHLTAVKK